MTRLSIDLDANELSYAKLIESVIERTEDTWNDYVDAAKEILKHSWFNRMAIAELAIRAVKVRHIEERLYEEGDVLSLRAFAEDIGMVPATLYVWVNIKKSIFDSLAPESKETFQHTAAERAYRRLGIKTEHPRELIQRTYERFATQTKGQKAIARALMNLRGVKKIFCKTEYWKGMSDDELNTIKDLTKTILARILELEKIKRR